jgi:hypothetical protein
MKTQILSALSFAALLSTAACAPAVEWKEPMTVANPSANGHADANLLVVNQRRMALPEGWSFQSRKTSDPKQIMFWIRDTGSRGVTGVYGFEHVGFPVAGPRAVERMAEVKLKDFSDVVAQRTELDNFEAYVVQGVDDRKGVRRISEWIFGHPSTGTDFSEITFLADKAYIDQNQRALYGILGSFKIVPRGLSERKLKGTFSFRCDDGSFSWVDDDGRRWQEKGFSVAGRIDDNGGAVISVARVTTTRFNDFLKMELFNPQEQSTVLHFANGAFPARAVHRNDPGQKVASTALMFNRAGKDYLVTVFRTYHTHPESIDPAMHDDPAIRAVLDSKFYFYE